VLALYALLVPAVLGQCFAVWTQMRLRRFVGRLARLRDERDLDEYRAEVRWQMYASLIGIVVLFGPLLVWSIGWLGGTFRSFDVALIALPATVGFKVTSGIGANVAMRELPAESEEIARTRDAIVKTWRKKALPDF